jgi:hypothetical protein
MGKEGVNREKLEGRKEGDCYAIWNIPNHSTPVVLLREKQSSSDLHIGVCII